MGYIANANFDDMPGSLPRGKAPDKLVDGQAVDWLNNLTKKHLANNAIWRDLLAFTDTYRTFHGPGNVFEVLQRLSKEKKRSRFELAGHEPRVIPLDGETSWLDVDLDFKIHDADLIGNCSAVISLIQNGNEAPQIWMIRTWLENYNGHGHPDIPVPGPNWSSSNIDHEKHIFDAIVAGGGQSGLGTAGRFAALGIDYMLFDNKPEIGDSWSQRYESLRWHTIREYGNLPFGRTFSPADPNMLPAKIVGARYKAWAKKHDIKAQLGTSVDKADWDNANQLWTVRTSGKHGLQNWKCRNLILSIGYCGRAPQVPGWASAEEIKASGFHGTVVHSADYYNAHDFAGKNGIVIGAANTGHDIAEDMANLKMKTTMVQRKPTFTIPGAFIASALSHSYNVDKSVDEADREDTTQPVKILRDIANTHIWGGIRANPEFFDELENAGYKVDRFGELYKVFYERLGGHWIDIGSSARITKGEIKVKSDPIDSLAPEGLRFADGSVVPADLIVLCTGFTLDYREDARNIIGDTADLMEDYWGIDEEGEVKGWAKLAGHPHLIYFGGEVRMARFMSRFVALQIQKMTLGGELKPFLEPHYCCGSGSY